MEPCVSPSGWKRRICQSKSSAYVHECPEGFLNQNSETAVKSVQESLIRMVLTVLFSKCKSESNIQEGDFYH